jgi:uncharacterized protein YjbI with pentapeptide repeats
LSGADFSRADLRGANFKNATLRGTQFCESQMGLQRRWVVAQMFAMILLATFGALFNTFTSYLTISSLMPDSEQPVMVVIVVISMFTGFLSLPLYFGFTIFLTVTLLIFILSFLIVVIIAFLNALHPVISNGLLRFIFVFPFSFALAFAAAATFTTSLTVSRAIAHRAGISIIVLFSILVAGSTLVTSSGAEQGSVIESISAFISTLFTILIFLFVTHRVWQDNMGFGWLRRVAIGWASWKGTSFQAADLTDANFSSGVFKNVDLRDSSLLRTNFGDARKLDFARLDSTYLADPIVRELVRTGHGEGLSLKGVNLRGIYLAKANLKNSDFSGYNLSQANLQEINLTSGKLVQTQLDSTDLMGAKLTGACIEGWGITNSTILDEVRCRYVFMCDSPDHTRINPHRKPDDWNEEFEDGDFADFIKPLADTLDLYHNRNVDPRAIAIAFKQLSKNNPEAQLQIVAMESKGSDKFLLRVQTTEIANKSDLSEEYSQTYQKVRELSPMEQEHLFAEKDARIESLEQMLQKAIERPSFTISQVEKIMTQNSGIDISGNVNQVSQTHQLGSGNVVTNPLTAGHDNRVLNQVQPGSLPDANTVDMATELMTLKQLLLNLDAPDRNKMERALADMEEELQKPEPDKDEVGSAFDRALTYANQANDFAESVVKLSPHVHNVAAWLGQNWQKLLAWLT